MNSMNNPTSIVKVTIAETCSSPEYPARASNTTSAIALALITAIYTELVNSAAIGVPIIKLYKPNTGLTPASVADAIPSGMPAMAAVKPAMISFPMVFRLMLRLLILEIFLYPQVPLSRLPHYTPEFCKRSIFNCSIFNPILGCVIHILSRFVRMFYFPEDNFCINIARVRSPGARPRPVISGWEF